MTIPNEVLAYVRSMKVSMAEALAHAEALHAQSNNASGPEAIGIAALAGELEQVGKVLKNYLPRMLKHVGEMAPIEDELPETLSDLVRENEPHGETRERLWALFISVQNRIADNGRYLEPPTSEDIILFARLYPHLGWLAKRSAIEVV
jgi:hypothetical protein